MVRSWGEDAFSRISLYKRGEIMARVRAHPPMVYETRRESQAESGGKMLRRPVLRES